MQDKIERKRPRVDDALPEKVLQVPAFGYSSGTPARVDPKGITEKANVAPDAAIRRFFLTR